MELGELIVRLKADSSPLTQALNDAESGIAKFSSQAERQFSSMSGAFNRLFTQVIKGDLKSILGSLLEVTDKFLQNQWVRQGSAGGINQLGSAIENGIGSILGGLIGGGRASGGGVSGGGPVLVGENGPEIFTPYASGMVTPNHQIKPVGGNITLNMTVVTPDAGSFRRSQGQILAEAAASLGRAKRNL